MRVREFITLGGFGLLDGLVIFIVKIVKRPMWPRFPRKLPFVVCPREGYEVALVVKVPPEASLFVVCSGEVCKGVVDAFKTNPE